MSEVDRRYLDTRLPLDQRVDCLVSQMSLAEKCGQMLHEAPAVERLGIPAYNWWNECLHGVARAGKATVFPQAIGMAASFNDELLFRVATAISDEARAKHHQALKQGYHGQYFGLTYWSPNINLFRDPRWGRGQETYGEDPFLTARMGVAFVRGLQGDDPKHLKLVATPKHYAVHSGPESERHVFDAVVSRQVMNDTYLPAFEATVREAKAASIMGAYNRVNGEPCCASPTLLTKILRQDWGFEGYVVSDCWALRDLHEHHKITKSAAESAALGVKHGCDLNCGCSYEELLTAVKQGLVSEAEVDVCVKRLFTARMRLGMFDPPEEVSHASIPPEVVNCPGHIELAREMARQSLVLLKNDGLLPLPKELNRVLVVGPNAQNVDALLANYNGFAPNMVTPFDGILEKLSVGSSVHCVKGCDLYHDEPVQKTQINWHLAKDTDAVIAVLGNTTELEGEEGEVALSDGGGDRNRLALPGRQQELLEFLLASGKPVVLVVMGGSPIDLSWAQEHVRAILFAWYPGEQGGAAIADAVFGDDSPAGRLPITFPKSLADLPPMRDYSMLGRTYRYSEAEPLYPFGYGLTYTTFEYSAARVEDGAAIATVTNVGQRASDEVAQCYLERPASAAEMAGPLCPKRSLVGFTRVRLEPGKGADVRFPLPLERLVIYDQEGRPVIAPGEHRAYIGGGQPHRPESGAVAATFTPVPFDS